MTSSIGSRDNSPARSSSPESNFRNRMNALPPIRTRSANTLQNHTPTSGTSSDSATRRGNNPVFQWNRQNASPNTTLSPLNSNSSSSLSPSLSLSSSPLSSPIITPAQTAERIQRIFTPEELAEHAPTREYVEQNKRK